MQRLFKLAFAILLVFALTNCVEKKDQKPMNVLFILVDDLGATDLSIEGSTYYESPNIDKLANSGMRFTRGYATCQVCSPSRASILTGKYTPNHGITTWIGDAYGENWRKRNRHDSHMPADYDHQLRESEITLAEAMRNAGYKTFFSGKWHLGDEGSWPTDHGFEINKGGFESGSPRGGYFSPYKNPNLKDGPQGERLPSRLAQETADFIEANQDQPFLAYLSFYAVHGPIQTTEELWAKYRDKAIAAGLPESRFIFDRKLGVRQVQDCPVYAGLVEMMDDGVGIVLNKLEELGLMENTIICFTGDNGGVSSGDAFSTSLLPYRGGKGRQWEGGIREPYYIYAPGITQPGSVCSVPVSGIDFYPTLLDLVGVEVPAEQKVDGVSLLPLLKGEKMTDRPLFWHYPHYGNQGGDPSSIIMEDEWKLIYYHEDGHYELYNIKKDIGEQNNVLAENAELAERMQTDLQKWLKDTGAKMPAADPEFDPKKKEEYIASQMTKGMQRLEKTHAHYLDADYKPNETWWDSQTKD